MRDPSERFAELKREFERQEQEWAHAEAELRRLSELPLAVSRTVLEDFDRVCEMFSHPRPQPFLQHFFR